ncbi:MAG: phage tail protein [Candidatus Cybelea sp.]
MSSGLLVPLHVFRFQVDFVAEDLTDGSTTPTTLAGSGAFAECTGLEATMEVKAIKEGGMNYGVAQRAGPTSFATVVLKRGISANMDLFNIFSKITNGAYAPRMQVTINVFDIDGSAAVAWQLDRAMPVKYKFADLNARGGGEVGIEELHLVHEGLSSGSPISLSPPSS